MPPCLPKLRSCRSKWRACRHRWRTTRVACASNTAQQMLLMTLMVVVMVVRTQPRLVSRDKVVVVERTALAARTQTRRDAVTRAYHEPDCFNACALLTRPLFASHPPPNQALSSCSSSSSSSCFLLPFSVLRVSEVGKCFSMAFFFFLPFFFFLFFFCCFLLSAPRLLSTRPHL